MDVQRGVREGARAGHGCTAGRPDACQPSCPRGAFAESSPEGELVKGKKGQPEPDTSLRDTENVPLTEDVKAYVEREVLPWAPEAWVDASKEKIGYEIPFTRVFYKYVPPRPLAEIDADVQAAIARVQALFAEVKA